MVREGLSHRTFLSVEEEVRTVVSLYGINMMFQYCTSKCSNITSGIVMPD